MSYISFKNLNFSYDDKMIFNGINIVIKKGSLTGILSGNSSGKSTLLKIINGSIKVDNVFIDEEKVCKKNADKLNKNIMLFDVYPEFYCKTIHDELLLESNNSVSKIKKLLKEFNMLDKINESPLNLSYLDMQKLNFIKALLRGSTIFLMDDILSYFDKYSKIEFIGLIKKYQCDNKITVIFTSSNLDDIIFCDDIIILSDGSILYNGPLEKIYLNEKLLKTSKINIPVFNELIDKLKLYDIVNDKIFTIDEVVDEICR